MGVERYGDTVAGHERFPCAHDRQLAVAPKGGDKAVGFEEDHFGTTVERVRKRAADHVTDAHRTRAAQHVGGFVPARAVCSVCHNEGTTVKRLWRAPDGRVSAFDRARVCRRCWSKVKLGVAFVERVAITFFSVVRGAGCRPCARVAHWVRNCAARRSSGQLVWAGPVAAGSGRGLCRCVRDCRRGSAVYGVCGRAGLLKKASCRADPPCGQQSVRRGQGHSVRRPEASRTRRRHCRCRPKPRRVGSLHRGAFVLVGPFFKEKNKKREGWWPWPMLTTLEMPQKEKKTRTKKASARIGRHLSGRHFLALGALRPTEWRRRNVHSVFLCVSRVPEKGPFGSTVPLLFFFNNKPGGVTSLCARLRSPLLFDPPPSQRNKRFLCSLFSYFPYHLGLSGRESKKIAGCVILVASLFF